jgi:hypothetical protein
MECLANPSSEELQHRKGGEVAQDTWHQEPEQRPAGGIGGAATRGLWHQRRETTRAQLPLTSAITLEERKRGSDGAAHQYTSHPRFRPAGLYG